MKKSEPFVMRGEKRVRIPLDHPETEAIAARMQRLLDNEALPDGVFGEIVKRMRTLRDADYSLARGLQGKAIPKTDVRPFYPDDYLRPSSSCFEYFLSVPHYHCRTECLAGWVLRLKDWVDNLEARYYGHAVRRPSCEVEDDI